MYEKIREEAKLMIENAIFSEKISLDEIEESIEGDFSFKTFQLGKKLNKNPDEISKEIFCRIKDRVKKQSAYFERVECVGPYLNFFLDYSKILSPLLKEILEKEENYGSSEKKEKKIILEHSSINPSGPVHIGRLRNSLIGDALGRILKFYGYEVEIHYYVNDIGKQIAIIAQGAKEGLKTDEEITEKYKEYKEKKDFQVFFMYVTANKKFEEDEKFRKKVQDKIKKAESGNKKELNEIRKIAKKCLDGQKETFSRLNIKFDEFDFESKFLENNDVEKILNFLKTDERKEYIKEYEGSIGIDLEKFGLKKRKGLTILARSDGTSVYLTRDIAYHLKKEKLGDTMINVLGEDHKFEFLELKTILEKIFHVSKDLKVVHYSFVNFESQELSTRKGLTAPVDKFIDEAIKKAEKEIEKRKIAEKEISPMIGIGAIKYHLLKISPEKPINFKWQEVLNFETESCPYVQYSYARCCSILKKYEENLNEIKIDKIYKQNLANEEIFLIKKLIKFPSIVEKSAKELKPNFIANFLYETAMDFSRFYKKCQVLNVEKKIEERRILIVEGTRIVIKNGLNLLGIEAPEKM